MTSKQRIEKLIKLNDEFVDLQRIMPFAEKYFALDMNPHDLTLKEIKKAYIALKVRNFEADVAEILNDMDISKKKQPWHMCAIKLSKDKFLTYQ